MRIRVKSFTLMELVIVIIVIGILSTIAATQYMGIKERALGREATVNLRLIAAAERIYRMETGVYYPNIFGFQTDVGQINNNLKLSLNENNWDYEVSGGPSSFVAVANRQGSGGYLDCQYSITQNQDEPTVTWQCP